MFQILINLHLVLFFVIEGSFGDQPLQMPEFVAPIENVTVAVGREAIIKCSVNNLGSYRVAFINVNTQTILSIGSHIITRSHRIGLSHTDNWTWNLHIKNVKEIDRGWYMCQINTDPMKSQNGYLQVVVPPDISHQETSNDMVVREGANVTLKCSASGFPTPTVFWKREDKKKISIGDHLVDTVEGSSLILHKVNRLHMGSYLCIASNGYPPAVSFAIRIIVHFAPMISIANQLIGVAEGNDVILECHSEAFPRSINYWRKGETGDIIVTGDKYESTLVDKVKNFEVIMRLTIREIDEDDYGSYTCLSKNSLGSTDGNIKLYRLEPSPSLTAKTTILPSSKSNVITRENNSVGQRREKSTTLKSKSNSTKTNYRKKELHESSINSQTSNQVIDRDLDDTSKGHLNYPKFYFIFPILLISILCFASKV